LDVALTVRPLRKLARGFRFEELARYAMRVAVAPKHELAKSQTVSLERVAREPLIGYSRQDYPDYHAMLERLFAPVGHHPRLAGEHDSVTSLIAAVESGHGFALVPECLACMVGPRLTLIPLTPPPPPITVGAIWRGEGGLAAHFIAAAKGESKGGGND